MDVVQAMKLVAALQKGLTAPIEETQRSVDVVNVVDGLFAIAQALAAVAGEVRQLNQTVHLMDIRQRNREGEH